MERIESNIHVAQIIQQSYPEIYQSIYSPDSSSNAYNSSYSPTHKIRNTQQSSVELLKLELPKRWYNAYR